MTIYTLGTGRRTEEDFVEILHCYGIEAFIDVRRFPKSKLPAYNRDYLERLIKENGIEYHFFGDELGGFRRGGYPEYTRTETFRMGIERLEEIAGRKVSVVVCAERFPWKCHRRWIARELKSRGWRVVHIIDKGKVWEPQ
ncbi:MAG: DUF488 family protein [Nitrospirae bacterium]|nr:DUF488 family protein [Nitrospirota bacterium]